MQNFWEISGWEKNDKHLRALKQAPFQRSFARLPSGPGLFVIRGPRQIGKSSWLKTMLSQHTNPKEIFYFSCEDIEDYKSLSELLKANKDRKVFLIDEISYVDQWWRPIKALLDNNDTIRIIVTGSHALDVKKGMDQMPGRWGYGGEFELLPMDFEEFSDMRKQAGWKALSRVEELELYFKVGGFPTSLIEAGEECRRPVNSMETYRRWLWGDLQKIEKSEVYLREILSQIALTTTSTISLQKLAQKTQIGSHNTAQDYVEVLEACFALKTIYQVDLETGAPRFRKEKKFYLRDPLIFWLALEWTGVPVPNNVNEMLAEIVAAEFLVRRYKRFGYYADKNGEIDFISAQTATDQPWAIEVKWKDQPTGLSKAYKNLMYQNKMVWTKNNFLVMEK